MGSPGLAAGGGGNYQNDPMGKLDNALLAVDVLDKGASNDAKIDGFAIRDVEHLSGNARR